MRATPSPTDPATVPTGTIVVTGHARSMTAGIGTPPTDTGLGRAYGPYRKFAEMRLALNLRQWRRNSVHSSARRSPEGSVLVVLPGLLHRQRLARTPNVIAHMSVARWPGRRPLPASCHVLPWLARLRPGAPAGVTAERGAGI